MKNIKSGDYTIAEALKECFYVVPDYQREYVWTEEQVTQLLNDINEQVGSDSEYFIGSILVAQKKNEENYFDVIDGQQRLTTIFLILCALRVRFADKKQVSVISKLIEDEHFDSQGDVETSLKLNLQYENVEKVIEKIFEISSIPQTVRAEIESDKISIHGSVKNILNAYGVIYSYLETNYTNEDELKKYLAYLVNKVMFIQISMSDVSKALKTFETINDRGVSLSPMDLLKNLLFTQVKKEEFDRLKNRWKEITDLLEKNKKQPLRFLRYFLMANYKQKPANPIIREEAIYDWLSENADQTSYASDSFGFVRKIKDNAIQHINFGDDLGNDGKLNSNMHSLKKLTGSSFSLHHIWLLAAADMPKPLFDQFVSQIEVFLFYYLFTKTPTKNIERSFSIWADDIRKISHPAKGAGEQKKELNEFVKTHFSSTISKKDVELEGALKLLQLDTSGMPKYRIKYLLARLAQYVDMKYRGSKANNLEHYLGLEIEHILPERPEDDLKESWAKENPDIPYDDALNRLGNLTLVEKPINIVASNDFYQKKVDEYANSGVYLTSSLKELKNVGQNTSITRINKKLLSFTEWNYGNIEARQEMLIKLAKEVWKITDIT